MEIVLLGTGSADGWPNAFCTCASCSAERSAGRSRGQTSALVDDVLLLDCGPTTPGAASRFGRSLAGVRHLLLTHAHIDHTAPAALLWRSWARRPEPLTVHGPAKAVEACRDWVGPDDPVILHVVAAGEDFDADGYRVQALAAAHGDDVTGDCLLWDVTAPGGERVLYATDTGPLPQHPQATYDLVLLEETFGDRLDHGTGHHDLATFPLTLAALRAAGALRSDSRVVAIHLGHHNPPTAELVRRLAAWGAEAHDDGTALTVPATAVSTTTPQPRHTLVLGGARSGKSLYAEALLADKDSVRYVATAGPRPDDPEWTQRVAVHRARRPASWSTLETADIAGVLRAAQAGDVVLVDCLTLWLTAVLDEAHAWDDPAKAEVVVDAATTDLLAAWRVTRALVVAVSNEVGQGVVPATASGRLFRDALGRLNAAVAAASEDVILLVAGRPLVLRPSVLRPSVLRPSVLRPSVLQGGTTT
jgi:adenosylcobinamide kinase / adenosylcobinamide-phosphate guanylyltransferase